MARKKKKPVWKVKKDSFWNLRYGCKKAREGIVQAGKEYSSIAAYAGRELTGQSHHRKPKCKLKKGWFE